MALGFTEPRTARAAAAHMGSRVALCARVMCTEYMDHAFFFHFIFLRSARAACSLALEVERVDAVVTGCVPAAWWWCVVVL